MKRPEAALMASVEHGLSRVGDNFAELTFYYLDQRCSLRKREILLEPERFTRGLHYLFGDGAQTIEKFIKQALCRNMKLSPDALTQVSLSDCLRKMKFSEEDDVATVR
jgi:hypothetical protein